MSNTNNIGLKNEIRNAATATDIERCLTRGDGYMDASDKTRRQWKRQADRRRAVLEQAQSPEKGKNKGKKVVAA